MREKNRSRSRFATARNSLSRRLPEPPSCGQRIIRRNCRVLPGCAIGRDLIVRRCVYFARVDNFRAMIRFCNRVGSAIDESERLPRTNTFLLSFIPPLFAYSGMLVQKKKKKKNAKKITKTFHTKLYFVLESISMKIYFSKIWKAEKDRKIWWGEMLRQKFKGNWCKLSIIIPWNRGSLDR